MNSFMQQLYMIPHFRQAIVAAQDPHFSQEQAQEDLLFQVQRLFMNLWQSDRKFYKPNDFCHAFKDYEGNPTNVT